MKSECNRWEQSHVIHSKETVTPSPSKPDHSLIGRMLMRMEEQRSAWKDKKKKFRGTTFVCRQPVLSRGEGDLTWLCSYLSTWGISIQDYVWLHKTGIWLPWLTWWRICFPLGLSLVIDHLACYHQIPCLPCFCSAILGYNSHAWLMVVRWLLIFFPLVYIQVWRRQKALERRNGIFI